MTDRNPLPLRKVLIISNLPLNAVSGIERFCSYLKAALEEHAIEVDAVSLTDIPPSIPFRLSTRVLPVLREYYWSVHWLKKRLPAYDLVITNNYTGGGINTRRHRVLNITHGLYKAGLERLRQVEPGSRIPGCNQIRAAEFLSKKKNRPATILTVSSQVHDELRLHYGLASDVLLNAVDTGHFRPLPEREELRRQQMIRPSDLVGIYAGRWNFFEKKLQYLVKLIRRRRDITWLLATDQRPEIADLANVRWLQDVDYAQMPMMYSMADFAIQLSAYEGCSYFSLEAISSSLPLISTPVGGTREIFDTEHARELLIPVWHDAPDFLDEVSRRVTLLQRNATFRTRIGQHFRETALQRFCIRRWQRELLRYLRLEEIHPEPPPTELR